MSNRLPESFSLAAILAEQGCTTRKDSESERLAKDNPELIPSPWNLRLRSWQNSSPGFPYLLLSAPAPFPNKISCFCQHVSPWTIHFLVLDKSPLSGPGRGPSAFLRHTCLLKKMQNMRIACCFIWGKMRTAAWETAPQMALRDCSKEIVGGSQYMWFRWRKSSWNQALILFY